MTWRGRSASEWMQALDDGAVAPVSGEREAEHVARVARAIEAPVSPWRPRIAWIAATTGALAAAAALAVLLASRGGEASGIAMVDRVQGELVASVDGRHESLSGGSVIVRGTTLEARGGAASISFSGGAIVALSDGSAASLVKGELVEGLTLLRGRVDVEVPQQSPGNSWSVTTETASITVVGTRFAVWLADDGGARVTCVAVDEGRVRTRSSASDALLDPGSRWSSAPASRACAGETTAPTRESTDSAPSPPPIERSSTRPPSSGPPRSLVSAPRPAPSSQLGEQNELFARIVNARRAGNAASARALAEEFLARHPSSPLAPQVRIELEKLPAGD